MRAVVLVGGFGTRLRPLTLHTPKQMLPVVGVTMLERVLSWLGSHGVTEAVLSLGYRPDAFTAAFTDQRCGGVQLRYAVEPEPLDTAGAIAFAAREAGFAERFVAINGDVLTDADLSALVADHDAHPDTAATIALTPVEDPSRYGVVDVDGGGLVRAFVEKPAAGTEPSHLINAGQYVLEPEVLDLVEPGRPTSIERAVFPTLAGDGRLRAVSSSAYWIDAGTPEAYLRANLDLVDGVRGHETALHASAVVAGGAEVTHSVVASGATVAPGAVVEGSVLLDGAVIEESCVVRDSIVGPAGKVKAGAKLSDLTVVGAGYEVEPGAVLRASLVPPPDTWG